MSSISAIGAGNAVVRTTRSAFRGSSASASRRKLSAARVGVRDFMSRLVTAGEAIQKLKREFQAEVCGRDEIIDRLRLEKSQLQAQFEAQLEAGAKAR